jgi:hypothetical protein
VRTAWIGIRRALLKNLSATRIRRIRIAVPTPNSFLKMELSMMLWFGCFRERRVIFTFPRLKHKLRESGTRREINTIAAFGVSADILGKLQIGRFVTVKHGLIFRQVRSGGCIPASYAIKHLVQFISFGVLIFG